MTGSCCSYGFTLYESRNVCLRFLRVRIAPASRLESINRSLNQSGPAIRFLETVELAALHYIETYAGIRAANSIPDQLMRSSTWVLADC